MAIQFWEFPVQWAEKFSVVSTFKTEIISSESGNEQRRALNYYPRRSFSFNLDALPRYVDELQYAMTLAQRNVVVMPEPVRRQRTTSAMPVGAATVSVDAVAAWMQEDKYVAVLGNGEVQVFQVSEIVGNTLAFTEGATAPWPVNSRIVPAWRGLLSESISFSAPTSRVMRGGVEFAVLPGEELALPPDPDIETTTYDREVFPFRVNWSDPQDVGYAQDRTVVDYGKGVIELFTPVAFNAKTYSADILSFTPEQAFRLTAFFERMKGRRGEFLFRVPMKLSMQLSSGYAGDNKLRLAGSLPRRMYASDPALRIIAVTMKDTGIVHYRKVVSATGEGLNSLLTLDLVIPEIISVDSVQSIDWLSLARFESDELTIDWSTTQVAQSRVVVRTIPFEEPEDRFTFDEGTQYLIDTYGAGFTVDWILDPLLIVLNEKEPRFALKY